MQIKLNSHEWVRKKISEDWFELQEESYNLYNKTKDYMINYIFYHKKRSPSSNNLEQVIDKNSEFVGVAGTAQVSFGIGEINVLNNEAKYWYVLNYGKTVSGERFLPGGGQYKPVRFGSSLPDKDLIGPGKGNQTATKFTKGSVKSFISPINYIEATLHFFGQELGHIIPK